MTSSDLNLSAHLLCLLLLLVVLLFHPLLLLVLHLLLVDHLLLLTLSLRQPAFVLDKMVINEEKAKQEF